MDGAAPVQSRHDHAIGVATFLAGVVDTSFGVVQLQTVRHRAPSRSISALMTAKKLNGEMRIRGITEELLTRLKLQRYADLGVFQDRNSCVEAMNVCDDPFCSASVEAPSSHAVRRSAERLRMRHTGLPTAWYSRCAQRRACSPHCKRRTRQEPFSSQDVPRYSTNINRATRHGALVIACTR